jgi:serine/threonine protein kinase
VSAPQDLIADRYRLVRRIGTGGMGVVWEAWDERLQRRVAVKQLRLPPGLTEAEAELANQRAMREARIAARLHHRHAVPVFDVVEDDGQPCLIMQFLPSITLAAVLREVGPLQPHEAAQVGAQVASALSAAHELGIVHRDVKPDNILIADDGTALISDFGIAHALGDVTLTGAGLVHGTPAYLSPEVARGEGANFASDVFSLGATLYAALEGSPPFGTDQNSIALMHRVAAGTFEPPGRAGPLSPLLMHMLSAEPSDRPSMRAAASSLAALASIGAEAQAPAPDVPTRPRASTTTAATAETPPERSLEAATTAAVGTPAEKGPMPAKTDPKRTERRRRMTWLGVAVVVLLAAGALIAVLVATSDNTGTVAQPPGPSTAHPSQQPSTSTTSAGPVPTSSQTSSPPAPTATKTSASPRPSSAAPTRTRSRVGGSPTKAQLVQAITSYYALMPENTDQAWPRMTASYQTNHAGGRRSYERFWGAIGRVKVRDVTASPPSHAQATLTYYFKDGRVVIERTSYALVRQGGTLKINDSTVLSSSTQ